MSIDWVQPWFLCLFPIFFVYFWVRHHRLRAPGAKGKLSMILHTLMLLCLVLALAGLRVPLKTVSKTGWLLLDVSDSVDEVSVLEAAQAALGQVDDNREIGIIAFGKDAQVLTTAVDETDSVVIPARLNRSGSQLDQAMLLAQALTEEHADSGIAIISDGMVDGIGDAGNFSVNTYTIPKRATADAQVSQVLVPGFVYRGTRWEAEVTVDASQRMQAQVLLQLDGETIAVREAALQKGSNTFVFSLESEKTGIRDVTARVIASGDTQSANDVYAAFTEVLGAPSVLVVEGRSGEATGLTNMLTASGFVTETILPARLPETAQGFQAYQAVVLVNVDHDDLTKQQEEALERGVRELGKGLTVLGGDQSYALGGYRGTLLEEMMPVSIEIRNILDMPSSALVLVIDKSGSMLDGMYGFTRIQMAREAASETLSLLTEKDFAGVIAFDDAGKWVIPLQKVEDVAGMQETVATIRAGGGTAFMAPLQMAYLSLLNVEARHKHIIFLTDGEAGDEGIESLVGDMKAHNISLTTVAVGDGVNTGLLKRLADLGDGRFYAAGAFDNLPKIFVKETLKVTQSYVQDRTFTPVITSLAMTDFDGFPPLHGYQGTTEKALATVSLVSDREDPILASWQYGIGKVVSWTSDVGGSWSRDFLTWEDAGTFFAGMVSYTLPAEEDHGTVHLEDGVLSVETTQDLTGCEVQARVLLPDQTWQEVRLNQVASKRFTVSGLPDEPGSYMIQVRATRDGAEVYAMEGGEVIRYSREYDLRRENEGALERLVQTSGGQQVSDPAALLQFPSVGGSVYQNLTIPLAILALCFLVLEVMQRRLDWERFLPKHAERVPQTPENRKERPQKKTAKRGEKQQGETTNALFEQMQHRKRM